MTDAGVSDPFTPGSIVADKFRIERVLGQGGMGVVVEATHLQLDQRVALKFLLPNALRQTESLARFAREARAAAAIRSEHVARVTDVGTLDNGAPYIVMEYLQGRDLARAVAAYGVLPIGEAVGFILQACEVLAEAHSLGIVHRDLKPSNLFITSYPDGTPCLKVLDFGISKLTSGSSADLNMTDTTTVMGTPHYMSPEQMRSTRSVDARSDIWALGVILYELLSGRVPFKADTMPQLCSLVLEEAPPPLAELRPELPVGLAAAVMRCLEKAPAARFQSIVALVVALAPFAPPEAQHSIERVARLTGAAVPSRATPNGAAGPGGATPGALSVDSARPARGASQASARQRKLAALVALAVGLGLAALGALVWLSQGRSNSGSAEPEAHQTREAPPPPLLSPPTPPPIPGRVQIVPPGADAVESTAQPSAPAPAARPSKPAQRQPFKAAKASKKNSPGKPPKERAPGLKVPAQEELDPLEGRL